VSGADFSDPATSQNCAKIAFQRINPIIGNFPDINNLCSILTNE